MSLYQIAALAWFATTLVINNCLAQDRAVINFSASNGLPSEEVYQVFQDRKGFLWFATDNGVVKYDGGNFEALNSNDGLSDPVVFGFHEDFMGRIWFRTFTGKLSYYQEGKIYKYKFNDSIAKYFDRTIPSDLYFDTHYQLWLTAGDVFIKVDSTGKITTEKIARYTLEIRKLNDEKDLITYSGPTHRIYKIRINAQDFPISQKDSTKSIGLICKVDWNNRKYFSINNSLYEYQTSVKKVLSANATIISLSLDKENQLWIGYMNRGAQLIKDSEFKERHAWPELDNKSVSKVFQDNEGGLWITTLEKGVLYFPNYSVRRSQLPTNSKIKTVVSTQQKVIIGDSKGNLVALGEQSAKLLWKLDLGSPITKIHVSNNNQIWASTNLNTCLIDKNGILHKQNLPANFIDFCNYTNVVFGINTHGLYKFDLKGNVLFEKELNAQYRNILVISGRVFMGGKNGLVEFDTLGNYIRELKDFHDIKISDLTKLTDSSIFISTVGSGFTILDLIKDKFKNYKKSSGFISNNIYSVIIKDTSVYIGSENGVATCSAKSLIKENPEYNFLTQRSGTVDSKVNFLARLPQELLVFCDAGYSRFPNEKMQFINREPKDYTKEIRVNDSLMKRSDKFIFSYHQNNIQIKIGFTSLTNQNVITRFRLNSHESWNYSDGWTYSFNLLPPGKYNFQLEYSTDHLNWRPSQSNCIFQIMPPWWGTWYSQVMIGVTLVTVGFVLYTKRIKKYKEKNTYLAVINEQQKKLLNAEIEATERERTRIAKELHDGISTDLASMKFVAEQLISKSETEEAVTIQHQLQSTLTELKDMVYGLAPTGISKFGLSLGYKTMLQKLMRAAQYELNLILLAMK